MIFDIALTIIGLFILERLWRLTSIQQALLKFKIDELEAGWGDTRETDKKLESISDQLDTIIRSK